MDEATVRDRFAELEGYFTPRGFPVIPSVPTRHPAAGCPPFLVEPGVALIQKPDVDLTAVRDFLSGYEVDYTGYLDDPVQLAPIAGLSKFAGQLCYMSLGEGRTPNERAEEYFDNIKAQQHGSVAEHGMFSFLLWGVSRSLTHELVRHRIGVGISQVSQRYVGKEALRFVMRLEYQGDDYLEYRFIDWITKSSEEYEARAEHLLAKYPAPPTNRAERTERRKAVRQAARGCLPNETEAPLVFSANVRALRHITEMRCSCHAESEIRELFRRVFLCAALCEPILFSDYEDDPRGGLTTPYRKI